MAPFMAAAERNSALELLRDLIADELRIRFGALHFVDKDLYFLAPRNILQFFFELRNFLSALSDHDARS